MLGEIAVKVFMMVLVYCGMGIVAIPSVFNAITRVLGVDEYES